MNPATVPPPPNFVAAWLDETQPEREKPNLTLLRERAGSRAAALPAICQAVKDHLLDVQILARLGMPRAASYARANMPAGRRARSGDMGEILGHEYAEQRLGYRFPVKRLRFKDHTELALRGDDLFALRGSGLATRVLKGECKSRATLTPSVVAEALEALLRNEGRPNQQTILFVARILRLLGRHREAERIDALFDKPFPLGQVDHLIFTFSGNNPTNHLSVHAGDGRMAVARILAGLELPDHQAFIREVFEAANA